MRLGSAYNKVTHCNTSLISTSACKGKQPRSRDVPLGALASGLHFPHSSKAAAHPTASARAWESEPYTGDLNQDFSKKQRQKALMCISNLNCWLCICNIIPSPISRPLSEGLVYVLALIAKFSFQLCTQRLPMMYFLSLHPKKVSTLIFSNHLLPIYSPIPQQALDKHTVLMPYRCSSWASMFI